MPGPKLNEKNRDKWGTKGGTRASAKYIRMSASKARVVLNLIRDKDVRRADEILEHEPQQDEPQVAVDGPCARRVLERHSADLVLDDLRIDVAARRVFRGTTEVDLSKTEFDLLELLVRNSGIVLDHSTIYDRIWGYDFGPDSKNLATDRSADETMDAWMDTRLREALQAGDEPPDDGFTWHVMAALPARASPSSPGPRRAPACSTGSTI